MKHWQLLGFFLILIFFFSSIDIFGVALTPDQAVYYHGDPDVDVYFTYMDQAREGRFWFCNQFAVEKHPCKLFFPLWFFAGRLGEIFNLSNTNSFIFIRVIVLSIFLPFFYYFCGLIFRRQRLLVFLAGIFSGGFSIYYFHSNLFLASLRNPLNLLTALLLLVVLWRSISYFKKPDSLVQGMVLAATAWLAVMVHPYEAIALFFNYGILLILAAIYSYRWFSKSLKVFLWIVLGMVPAIFYYLLIFLQYPSFSDWLLQNYLPIYNLKSVFLNFGLLIPLAIFGGYYLLRNKVIREEWLILLSWFFGVLITLFLPLYINNKLLLAWYFGLFFMAATIFLKKFRWPAIFWLLILLLFVGNFNYYLLQWRFLMQSGLPHYVSVKYSAPLNWLKQHSPLNDALLASYRYDTFLAWGGLKSFIGSNQVVNYSQKKALTEWFFSSNINDDLKKIFLKKYSIDYLLFWKQETILGNFSPASKDYLRRIYDDGWSQIYQVIY